MEQNQATLGEEITHQLELTREQNLHISQNRAVINSLNREFIQLNNSMTGIADAIQALEFSRNFILAMLQV